MEGFISVRSLSLSLVSLSRIEAEADPISLLQAQIDSKISIK